MKKFFSFGVMFLFLSITNLAMADTVITGSFKVKPVVQPPSDAEVTWAAKVKLMAAVGKAKTPADLKKIKAKKIMRDVTADLIDQAVKQASDDLRANGIPAEVPITLTLKDKPFYKKGLFWGIVGTAAVIGLGLLVASKLGAFDQEYRDGPSSCHSPVCH